MTLANFLPNNSHLQVNKVAIGHEPYYVMENYVRNFSIYLCAFLTTQQPALKTKEDQALLLAE